MNQKLIAQIDLLQVIRTSKELITAEVSPIQYFSDPFAKLGEGLQAVRFTPWTFRYELLWTHFELITAAHVLFCCSSLSVCYGLTENYETISSTRNSSTTILTWEPKKLYK